MADARTKLRELILHISIMSAEDERFSGVKLNKLLFFSDFDAFRDRGESITGVEYQKLPHGPAPRFMKPVLDRMIADGELVIDRVDYHNHKQYRPRAMRSPDLTGFTPEQIEFVNARIERYWEMNATEVSAASHETVGWKLAEVGETIPYVAALIVDRPPTRREIERAKELAIQYADLIASGQ